MKVTLLSPYPDIASVGLRGISSVLKKNGYKTQLIFFPNLQAEESVFDRFVHKYDPEALTQLVNICKDSDLIGLSLMTNYFEGSVQITQAIKSKLDVPVVWGGIHPTICPDECLQYADIVCIGEGEDAILELAHKIEGSQNYHNIDNLWTKYNGNIIRNDIRPLNQDLDSLPYLDYDDEDHFILDDGQVKRMNSSLLEKFLMRASMSRVMGLTAYQTMVTRGCNLKCTYCCNNALRKLYPKQRYIRRRSSENVINELLAIKKKFNFIESFWFSDDSFVITSTEKLKEFCEMYKAEINFPFCCLVSPTTINEKKMEYLVDAGLKSVQMGIETGSDRIKRIYNRKIPNRKVIESANIINKYRNKISPPLYDFIINSDFETDADILETLELIIELPRPYNLQLFSLVIYPGTDLYRMAKDHKLLQNEKHDIYQKRYHYRKGTYLDILFSLCKLEIPKVILKFLTNRKVVQVLNTGLFNFVFTSIFYLLKRYKQKFKR